MLVFCAGSRPATAVLARIRNSDFNSGFNPHHPTHLGTTKATCSCPATLSTNPPDHSAPTPTPHLRRSNPHRARPTAPPTSVSSLGGSGKVYRIGFLWDGPAVFPDAIRPTSGRLSHPRLN